MTTFAAAVATEVARARAAYPPMHSPHEGLAVLQEEVHELQQEVYRKQSLHDPAAMYDECVQIGAMAQRFAEDLLAVAPPPYTAAPATGGTWPTGTL